MQDVCSSHQMTARIVHYGEWEPTHGNLQISGTNSNDKEKKVLIDVSKQNILHHSPYEITLKANKAFTKFL